MRIKERDLFTFEDKCVFGSIHRSYWTETKYHRLRNRPYRTYRPLLSLDHPTFGDHRRSECIDRILDPIEFLMNHFWQLVSWMFTGEVPSQVFTRKVLLVHLRHNGKHGVLDWIEVLGTSQWKWCKTTNYVQWFRSGLSSPFLNLTWRTIPSPCQCDVFSYTLFSIPVEIGTFYIRRYHLFI